MKSIRLDVFIVGILFIAVGVQARHAPDFKIEFGRVASKSDQAWYGLGAFLYIGQRVDWGRTI